MRNGDLINTAGNVVHYLGMGWAGRCGEPLGSAPDNATEVPFLRRGADGQAR